MTPRILLPLFLAGFALPLAAADPAPPANDAPAVPTEQTLTPRQQLERDITQIETERRELLNRYTPLHPEIRILDRRLDSLRSEYQRMPE